MAGICKTVGTLLNDMNWIQEQEAEADQPEGIELA
jgi:hypothetical protein